MSEAMVGVEAAYVARRGHALELVGALELHILEGKR
jgi:hypothetical protein